MNLRTTTVLLLTCIVLTGCSRRDHSTDEKADNRPLADIIRGRWQGTETAGGQVKESQWAFADDGTVTIAADGTQRVHPYSTPGHRQLVVLAQSLAVEVKHRDELILKMAGSSQEVRLVRMADGGTAAPMGWHRDVADGDKQEIASLMEEYATAIRAADAERFRKISDEPLERLEGALRFFELPYNRPHEVYGIYSQDIRRPVQTAAVVLEIQDTTPEFGRTRYIAILIAKKAGRWRVREWAGMEYSPPSFK